MVERKGKEKERVEKGFMNKTGEKYKSALLTLGMHNLRNPPKCCETVFKNSTIWSCFHLVLKFVCT